MTIEKILQKELIGKKANLFLESHRFTEYIYTEVSTLHTYKEVTYTIADVQMTQSPDTLEWFLYIFFKESINYVMVGLDEELNFIEV